MKAIVAVDKNWGIGFKGNLLERIPSDMKFFKETTVGKVVVMGRATFESLPNKEPLKDRVNIVLSRSDMYREKDIMLCKTKDQALHILDKYDRDDVFIIGGESIYNMFLPYCDEVYVTKIYNEYKADKFFANLDEIRDWSLVKASEEQSYNGIKFKFCVYKKARNLE
ncbi:MAG: dihydrofolate reductase [Clostridiales bacterium]|nr:dihydrofolate reductase [Clostridiales bacterium]